MFLGKEVPKSFSIKICDFEVASSEKIEILGVILDNKLKFDLMIKEICRKAGSQINVLQRIKSRLDRSSRMAIYNSFVLSNLLYCQLVWMNCGMLNIRKLEKVNERALRFVNNDYDSDYESQLIQADKNRLLTLRIVNMGIEVYKARMGLTTAYIQEMFVDEVTVYNLRAERTVLLPVYKTRTYGYRSFTYLGAKLWNSMPNDLRLAPTLPRFKALIKDWAKRMLNLDEFV